MIEDSLIDDKEIESLDHFVQNLADLANVPSSQVLTWLNVYGTSITILQGRELHKIKNGIETDADAPRGLMLTKGERFLYSWPAACHALNIKTKFKARSTGGSYRLSRKFTIRHTEHRGKPVSYTEWKEIGRGTLAVTNKHLYFLGVWKCQGYERKIIKCD